MDNMDPGTDLFEASIVKAITKKKRSKKAEIMETDISGLMDLGL